MAVQEAKDAALKAAEDFLPEVTISPAWALPSPSGFRHYQDTTADWISQSAIRF